MFYFECRWQIGGTNISKNNKTYAICLQERHGYHSFMVCGSVWARAFSMVQVYDFMIWTCANNHFEYENQMYVSRQNTWNGVLKKRKMKIHCSVWPSFAVLDKIIITTPIHNRMWDCFLAICIPIEMISVISFCERENSATVKLLYASFALKASAIRLKVTVRFIVTEFILWLHRYGVFARKFFCGLCQHFPLTAIYQPFNIYITLQAIDSRAPITWSQISCTATQNTK